MFKEATARTIAAGIGIVAGLAFASSASAETWRMASAYPESNFHTQNINEFIKDVSKATDGSLEIQLSSGSSLYKAPEILSAVETGQIQIGEILYAAYGNENPLYAMDAIPYIISGYDQAYELYQATKPLIEEDLKKRGLTLLYSVAWPGAGIYSIEELDEVSDLPSVVMRSPAPIIAKWTDQLGMRNIVIQTPELAQAFSSGMVNAMFTSSPIAPSIQAWEYLNHFYDLGALQSKDAVIVRTDALDALTEEQRKAVFDAAARAEERGWQMSKEADKGYKQQMIDGGMTVGPIDPEVEAYLKEKADIVIEEWLEDVPEDLRTAVNSVRN
jgi:TRAP-type C4-dicarboxylate transport system substrate-binding protein